MAQCLNLNQWTTIFIRGCREIDMLTLLLWRFSDPLLLGASRTHSLIIRIQDGPMFVWLRDWPKGCQFDSRDNRLFD